MKKSVILLLLSDHMSISETIILKSLKFLTKKKNNYLFLGSSFFFKKLAKKTNLIKKIEHFDETKNNFFDIGKNFNKKRSYIHTITDIAINYLKKNKANALINMPLNKKILGKFHGYTEFFANKLGQFGKENMLLYSEQLAVCPLTTHVPLVKVSKLLNKKKIFRSVKNINHFYKKIIKKKIKIKICGLNPHSGKDFKNKNYEEKKIIIPSIRQIIKKHKNVTGPYSADTVFLNSHKSVIIGMYHDQVLAPFKALKNFNAINITIGLKYLRLSPDHGTGLDILNKKKISNKSFKHCINFCEKYLNV